MRQGYQRLQALSPGSGSGAGLKSTGTYLRDLLLDDPVVPVVDPVVSTVKLPFLFLPYACPLPLNVSLPE